MIASLRTAAALAALALAGACSTATNGSVDTPAGTVEAPPAASCEPVSLGAANAADQQPAFAGQTRACRAASGVTPVVTPVATGLNRPWAIEPMANGGFLVTLKGGELRMISANGTVGAAIAGVPTVDARGQGGLLDVTVSPQFATDRLVYMSFTEPRNDGNGTSVARGRLSADGSRLESVQVLLRTRPSYTNNMHYGSRLNFGPDGNLYVTMGERSDVQTRPQAQELGSHFGKVLRIRPDGSVPQDNPFVGRQGALPEIWSLGHRNIQAATFDAGGGYWVIEHGTRGGDEVNLVNKGANYGWPVAAYGVEYGRGPITSALGQATTQRPGTEQPAYYWDPVIAPSGAEYYTGGAFPAWRNSLFVGGLASTRLVRLTIGAGGRIAGEEHLLAERGKRIRDVKQGPDGNLYVVTDGEGAELWRLSAR